MRLMMEAVIGGAGASFCALLVYSMVRFVINSTKDWSFKWRRIRRFVCDVIAIGGASVAFMACTILMAKAIAGLFL